jgi:sulfur carrier protein
MSILVNGHIQAVPDYPTLAALLLVLAPPLPFAVAYNGEFVPRARYEKCHIQPGDCIEIVHPAAGG